MLYFIELLRAIWDKIKKFFVKVLNFVNNIVSFFRNPERLNKLKEDRDLIAVSIKDKLENGQFRVVNCLYDKVLEEVVEVETDAIGIEAEKLDNDARQKFGNKDMIVLN
ncbi:hypothetical protein [uncultured Brachyspira sp.]|uniref:hypothetical protein n=1 Tax=uncultured Brachyspira sp. TaxID=221953 RepID=UPI0027DD3189|nr:hypothetical protein [uncultured Brachyspira sp.]